MSGLRSPPRAGADPEQAACKSPAAVEVCLLPLRSLVLLALCSKHPGLSPLLPHPAALSLHASCTSQVRLTQKIAFSGLVSGQCRWTASWMWQQGYPAQVLTQIIGCVGCAEGGAPPV